MLLIPCTNVSALLVGLAAARRREIVVRLAMGAARGRLVRQLLTESVLVSVAAGALGLWVIWLLLRFFGARIPDLQVNLHWPVLVFTAGFAILVGVVFGISPALHATRVGVSDVLKDAAGSATTSRSRLQSGLVAAQVAFMQPLLLLLGTLITDMRADAERRPGLASGDRIVEMRFRAPSASEHAGREATLRALSQRLASLPSVEGAVIHQGFTTGDEVSVHHDDRVAGHGEQQRVSLRVQPAAPGYLELIDVPMLRGRPFGLAEANDAGSVIIGSALARQLWGGADPIGRRLVRAGSSATLRVTGVVDDRAAGFSSGDNNVFVPTLRVADRILVRTAGPADAQVAMLRTLIATEAPRLTLTSIRTLAALDATARSTVRQVVSVAVTTGVIALCIGAIGLYAVVAFAVGQRTREIGIRTALGADRRRVVRAFMSRGLRVSTIGMVIGLGLSVAAVRISTAVRGEALPEGTWALGGTIVVLVVGVALVATWLPARRAASVDPLQALRVE